jgi:hypothetical protein
MTKEQKEQILTLCKEHIDEHGSVRVGWAAKEIIGSAQQNHIKDKIAATLVETGEFVKEPSRKFELDWNVRKNPEFRKRSWTEKRPVLFEIVKGSITAIFSIGVSVILSISIINKSEDKKQTNFNDGKENRSVELKASSLTNSENSIQDSIGKILK